MIPKFRAWDINYKEMVDVDTISWKDGKFDSIGDGVTEFRESGDIKLMQSTGLMDKNGKEIFEGDVLCDEGLEQEDEFVYVKVFYSDGMWNCAQITNDDCGYGGSLNEFTRDYSVIGNIYENPELVEVRT